MALSNHRLRQITPEGVTFDYKDYASRDPHKIRRMTLQPDEFIRRFLLHTLPSGFQRIRHYGLLAARNKKSALALCRTLLAAAALLPSPAQIAECVLRYLQPSFLCPVCGIGEMIRIEVVAAQPYAHPVPADTS